MWSVGSQRSKLVDQTATLLYLIPGKLVEGQRLTTPQLGLLTTSESIGPDLPL